MSLPNLAFSLMLYIFFIRGNELNDKSPNIWPVGPVAVFLEKSTFTLNCTSHQNVTWDLPINYFEELSFPLRETMLVNGTTENDLSLRVKITHYESYKSDEQERVYGAVLVVERVRILDTGHYTCRCVSDGDSSQLKQTSIEASKMVFILELANEARDRQFNYSKVSDKQGDIVYEYQFSDIFPFKTIYSIKPHEEFVIPCFVSTGETLVVQKRLEKSTGWRTISYYKHSFSERLDYLKKTWSYGTFEGIVLFELSVQHNGEYRCMREIRTVDRWNKQHWLTSYSKSFYVSIIEGQLFQNTPPNDYFVIPHGTEFSLACRANLETNIKWNYPKLLSNDSFLTNSVRKEKMSTVNVSNQEFGRNWTVSTILVSNATHLDTGFYICSRWGINNPPRASKFVLVQDLEKIIDGRLAISSRQNNSRVILHDGRKDLSSYCKSPQNVSLEYNEMELFQLEFYQELTNHNQSVGDKQLLAVKPVSSFDWSPTLRNISWLMDGDFVCVGRGTSKYVYYDSVIRYLHFFTLGVQGLIMKAPIKQPIEGDRFYLECHFKDSFQDEKHIQVLWHRRPNFSSLYWPNGTVLPPLSEVLFNKIQISHFYNWGTSQIRWKNISIRASGKYKCYDRGISPMNLTSWTYELNVTAARAPSKVINVGHMTRVVTPENRGAIAKAFTELTGVSRCRDSNWSPLHNESEIFKAITFGDNATENQHIVKVNLGNLVSLFCQTLDALPNPRTEWTRQRDSSNDESIYENISYLVANNLNRSITELSFLATVESSGYYKCRFSNWKGEVHRIFDLRIIDAPPYITDSMQIFIEEGARTELVCKGNSTVLNSDIQWLKETNEGDEELFGNETFIQINTTGSFSILTLIVSEYGQYKCRILNHLGIAEKIFKIDVTSAKIKTENLLNKMIVIVLVGIIGTGIFVVVLIFCAQRLGFQRTGLAFSNRNEEIPLKNQLKLIPYSKKRWEFKENHLKQVKFLGSGCFGSVYQAKATGKPIASKSLPQFVAVKTTKSSVDNRDELKALVCELKMLIILGSHQNVVKLLGACTSKINQGELSLVMEFCHFGSLEKVIVPIRSKYINLLDINGDLIIQNNLESGEVESTSIANEGGKLVMYSISEDIITGLTKGDLVVSLDTEARTQLKSENYILTDCKCPISKRFCTKDLICWSWQVSRGMDFLSSKKVIHGDLAARNVLLSYNRVVKLCDFGLSRRLYYNNTYIKKGQERMPFKSMAIESLELNQFTSQSDVWSYGVLLWELFSLIKKPYEDVTNMTKLIEILGKGQRLERPEKAPKAVTTLMFACWDLKPNARPMFDQLEEALKNLLVKRPLNSLQPVQSCTSVV